MTNGFKSGWWAAFGLAACGDVTSASGELGRLEYALATDYDAETRSLVDAGLLTGHPIELQVDLTERGAKEANDRADEIHHQASAGALEAHDGYTDDPADFALTVDEPGVVTVTSTLDGEIFDHLDFRFARPAELELVTWARAPWEDQWTGGPTAGPITLEEGGQISFLAIPLEDDGNRILGEFTPEITVDPPTLAVPDATVVNVYEERPLTAGAPVSFFAIEPGVATFTLTDAANDVSVTIEVTIEPIAL